MNTKKIATILLSAALISSTATAQDQKPKNDFSKYEHKHAFCKPWIGNNKMLENFMEEIDYQNQKNPIYSIPVTLWVYGDTQYAPSASDIKETIQNLNKLNLENNTLISYYLADTKFKTSKRFNDFSFGWNMRWQSILHHKRKTLNLYLVPRLTKRGSKNKDLDFSGVCNTLNNSVFVAMRNDESVVTHEMAHALGLKHPHENCQKGKHKQESVEREQFRGGIFRRGNNCEINGDGLKDTEASPLLANCTDKNGNYTKPELADKWGKKYEPQLDNIMGYNTKKSDRRKFTYLQKAVMLYTLSENKMAENWKIAYKPGNSVNGYLPDIYEPDNFYSHATTLKDKIEQEHTIGNAKVTKQKTIAEIDCFKFTIPKSVNIEKSGIYISDGQFESNENLGVMLLDENKANHIEFTKKAGEDLKIEFKDCKIGTKPLTPGTYYLVVAGADQNTSSYKIVLNLDQTKIMK